MPARGDVRQGGDPRAEADRHGRRAHTIRLVPLRPGEDGQPLARELIPQLLRTLYAHTA